MNRRLAAIGAAMVLAAAGAVVSGGTQADLVKRQYLPEANALRTVAVLGEKRRVIVSSLGDPDLVRGDPGWLRRARPLGVAAPGWARRMQQRSLLVLRALTDRRGAAIAGAREGWAYVWPRDAGATALAFAAAGYRQEAKRIARFLLGLDLDAAARFQRDGEPVPGRAAQGDAAGWVMAAAKAAGVGGVTRAHAWRGRADYHEGDAGEYLGNAIAAGASLNEFVTSRGLVRAAGDPGSGLDSSAAWAVQLFPRPALSPAVRRTLLRLAAGSGRFGIVPSEGWQGGEDPWTAPTAWTAWGLAALGERRAALRLMAALRRAATSTGMLPERVDARTGLPTSTTPLAWSHAFAILAIRELWPRTASTSLPARSKS
jgi:hypothetical protein